MGDQIYAAKKPEHPQMNFEQPLMTGLFAQVSKEANAARNYENKQKLTSKNKDELVQYGKENNLSKDYFEKVDKAKTWGDVKQVFSDLNLNFNQFMKWVQEQIDLQGKQKSTGTGSGKPVGWFSFVSYEVQKKMKKQDEEKEREKELVEKHGAA